MVNILNILKTIYELSEEIEAGKEFDLDRDFGPIKLRASAVLTSSVDESTTLIVNRLDTHKVSKTLINVLLSALMGTPMTEGMAVPLGTIDGKEDYLVVVLQATLK